MFSRIHHVGANLEESPEELWSRTFTKEVILNILRREKISFTANASKEILLTALPIDTTEGGKTTEKEEDKRYCNMRIHM